MRRLSWLPRSTETCQAQNGLRSSSAWRRNDEQSSWGMPAPPLARTWAASVARWRKGARRDAPTKERQFVPCHRSRASAKSRPRCAGRHSRGGSPGPPRKAGRRGPLGGESAADGTGRGRLRAERTATVSSRRERGRASIGAEVRQLLPGDCAWRLRVGIGGHAHRLASGL